MIDAAVELASATGPLPVRLHAVDVGDVAIVAEFDVTSAVHDRLLDEGGLHLGPLVRGIEARRFGDGDVRIEASLDPRLAPGVLAVGVTSQTVTQLLAVADATVLRSVDSWYALTVSHEVELDPEGDDELAAAMEGGSLREGYRTMWWSRDGALALAAHLAEAIGARGFGGVEALAEPQGFRWHLTGADASWTCVTMVDESADTCVVYSVLDVPVADADRAAVAARVGALNGSLRYGAWQLDDDTPAVRFRSSVELPDRTGATASIGRLLDRNLDIVDEYAGLVTAT